MAASFLSAGLNFLQAESQYESDKAMAKAKQQWQQYSNTMLRLQDSFNQNTITSDRILTKDYFDEQAKQIQDSYLQTSASVENSAAAAGVAGNSVVQVLQQSAVSAAQAEVNRQKQLTTAMQSLDNQSAMSHMSANMQQDYTPIKTPSRASYYIGALSKSLGGSDKSPEINAQSSDFVTRSIGWVGNSIGSTWDYLNQGSGG